MYENIQVKILGWFLRGLRFQVLIRFDHVSSILYQQGSDIYTYTLYINFCSQSCTNILRIFIKNSAPHGKIESLRLSDTLKLSSKQKKLQKEMHL